jgi:hypothetical protein
MEPVPVTPPLPAKQRTESELERARLVATTDSLWLMYVQSLLVWNIPSHLAVLLLGSYLVVTFGEAWIISRLSIFQLAGIALMVWGCLSLWLARRARKEAKRAQQPPPPSLPKEQLERGLFWPQDAAGVSAESYPLGLKLFTGRVKLLPHEQLMDMFVQGKESLRRALYAFRILRYSDPTQFALNVCFVCFVVAVVGSYFSGKTVVLVSLYALLLGPGLARRQVLAKLRRRLEMRIGRPWVEWLLVSNYLNLDETNTAKVVAFVRSTDDTDAAKPKVVTKPIA